MKKLILVLLIIGMGIPILGNAQIHQPFTLKDLADVKTQLGQTESALIYWNATTGLWEATSNGGDGLPFLDFDTEPVIPEHKEGRVHWVDDDKTLELDTEQAGTHIQLGQEVVLRAFNDSVGYDITDGSVVYLTGASGSKPTVDLADADIEELSYAVGVATSVIEEGKSGYVTTWGLVRGIDTSDVNCTAGATAWLSGTAGEFECGLPPNSPIHAVHIGKILFQSADDGIMLVNPINGAEVNELHDVDNTITSGASSGDMIYWDGSTLWKARDYSLYGSMFTHDTPQAITITDANTAYKVTWESNNNCDGVTCDSTTDNRLTFPTAGKYKVDGTLSFSIATVAGTEVVHCYVSLNGTKDKALAFQRSVSNLNVGDASVSGFIAVTADQYIEMYCENSTGTRTLTIEHGNLNATLISY